MNAQSRITAATVIGRNREPVTAEVDGTVVMMSLVQGKYFGLDEIGSRIWELLETPTSVGAIRDKLLAEYDIDAETCERDVTELLEVMMAEALICVLHEASS